MIDTDKPGPGKFEGNTSLSLADYLNILMMEGMYDDQFGDVETTGWFAKIAIDKPNTEQHIREQYGTEPDVASFYIVNEDNNGFFTYRPFSDEYSMNKAWEIITRMYNG